MLNPKRF